jgi:ketosteroid isomerase-like protein
MTPGDVALRYLGALSGDDPDAVAALVAVDFSNEHLSALGSNSLGRDEYRRRLPGFMADLAGRQYEIVDVVSSGDVVVVRYRLTATAEGTTIDIPGMMWITVTDGEVTRRIDCWDSQTFLDQTGPGQTDPGQTDPTQTDPAAPTEP